MRWLLSLVALGLGTGALMFGRSLLPSFEVMQSKLGTLVPLYLTWGMIWITIAIAVALAGFLIATGLGMIEDADA